ncbi:hypothetical protein AB0I93_37525 [Streptomyces sp. NPDC049967]
MSLERLCAGGEINYVIAAVSSQLSGKQPAAVGLLAVLIAVVVVFV